MPTSKKPSVVSAKSVASALNDGSAVVALESTIITHGMPYPQNIETALAVEQAIRKVGATPATIAVVDGQLRVGLDEFELDSLAQTANTLKLSRADLAYAISQRRTGSTTVAATMIVAHLAGISVFATGGIGGVHRGASESFDVSADLQELARTPVTVVSAGAKAILDIPKTLEVLETLGVPVVAFAQDNLPAFWSADSGIAAPIRMDTAQEIVDFMRARTSLNMQGGMLIGNPVNNDSEIPKEEMEVVITKAVAEAEQQGIKGKAVTPWLLGRIVELTSGASLITNQSLIANNAKLAAEIAVAYSASQS